MINYNSMRQRYEALQFAIDFKLHINTWINCITCIHRIKIAGSLEMGRPCMFLLILYPTLTHNKSISYNMGSHTEHTTMEPVIGFVHWKLIQAKIVTSLKMGCLFCSTVRCGKIGPWNCSKLEDSWPKFETCQKSIQSSNSQIELTFSN